MAISACPRWAWPVGDRLGFEVPALVALGHPQPAGLVRAGSALVFSDGSAWDGHDVDAAGGGVDAAQDQWPDADAVCCSAKAWATSAVRGSAARCARVIRAASRVVGSVAVVIRPSPPRRWAAWRSIDSGTGSDLGESVRPSQQPLGDGERFVARELHGHLRRGQGGRKLCYLQCRYLHRAVLPPAYRDDNTRRPACGSVRMSATSGGDYCWTNRPSAESHRLATAHTDGRAPRRSTAVGSRVRRGVKARPAR